MLSARAEPGGNPAGCELCPEFAGKRRCPADVCSQTGESHPGPKIGSILCQHSHRPPAVAGQRGHFCQLTPQFAETTEVVRGKNTCITRVVSLWLRRMASITLKSIPM